MAFDISTARPEKKSGFDISSAKPVDAFEQQKEFNKTPIGEVPDPSSPQQPDLTKISQPPFGVSYNLFRGAKTGEDVQRNAQQMGFDFQPTADNGLLLRRGDEIYRYEPDSIWTGFVNAIRPTAQTAGNVAGAILSTPAAIASGPFAPAVVAAGSTAGGVSGGQLADSLVQLAEPRGSSLNKEISQGVQDIYEQGAASMLGPVVGQGVGKVVGATKNAISTVAKPRIEPTLGLDASDVAKVAPSLPQASEKTYQQLVDNIKTGNIKKVAPQVRPDLGLKKIAEEEGIYLNPSHYSKNPVYVETEQAMKSRPGSLLNAREQSAIVRMGEIADDIKSSIGGYSDRSQLNSDYTQKVVSTLDAMRKQEGELYQKVSDAAPKGTKVNPKNTLAYLQSRIDDLGGEKNLTPEELKVWSRFRSGKVNLALLDETRKQIGSGYNKQGPFKDAESRLLDGLYSSMTKDQEGIARYFGVDDIYQLAKKTTQDRKTIEEGISQIYGNSNISAGLDFPLAARLDSAVMGLTKGDVNNFRKVVQMVPKDMRQSAVATSLDSIFTNGARNKNNSIGQGFIAGYESLQKNAAARKELNQYLPSETIDRMDNLYRVAKGVYSAKRWENTSGTARAMLANMDKDASVFQKLYGVGRKALVAEAAGNSVGMPGAGTVVTVANALSTAAKDPASRAADLMIAGPAFNDAVQEYAANQQGVATKRLLASKPYQEWLAAQPEANRKSIAATGFFSFLFGRQTTEPPKLEEQPSKP